MPRGPDNRQRRRRGRLSHGAAAAAGRGRITARRGTSSSLRGDRTKQGLRDRHLKLGCRCRRIIVAAPIGETRVAEPGADRQDAPARHVGHEGHLAQAHERRHRYASTRPCRDRRSTAWRPAAGRVGEAAAPSCRAGSAAALDGTVLLDQAGAADADEWRQLGFAFSALRIRSPSIATGATPPRPGTARACHRDGATAPRPRPRRPTGRVPSWRSTTPARMLVPPISTARRLSWPNIQDGARWIAPIRPTSSG